METVSPPVIQIERHPGRCGGDPTLAGTRTTVHDIVAYVQLYEGDIHRVVEEFPSLTVEVVEAIMAWYRDHMDEIDAILRRRRERYESLVAKRRADR